MAKLLNHQEAADLLGITVSRIEEWLRKGLIPYVQIGDMKQLDKDTLLDWYDNQIVWPKKRGE
jgi:excisionase family DNA binding protein